MNEKSAWEKFKTTGDINAFLEYKQIQNLENGIMDIEEIQRITDINIK